MAEMITPANVGSQPVVETPAVETPITEEVLTTGEEGTEAASEGLDKSAKPKEADAIKKIEKALKRKFKLKVDGQDFEEEFDLDNEEEVVKKLQLAKVSQKRMGEKAQLEKEVREFIDQLRKNPRKVLSDPNLGLDLKQFAAQILEEEILNSQKSPEILAKEKLEQELRDLKEQTEKEKDDYKKKEFERLQEREFERYDTLMGQALAKTDLPKSPYVVKKMADYMLLGLQNNLNVSPEDVLPIVREEIMGDIKAMFEVMPEEVIEKFLGKDILSKLRKKNVTKSKNPAAPLSKVTETGKKAEIKDATPEKLDMRKYFGF